jgi:serine/threonine-protein kinase
LGAYRLGRRIGSGALCDVFVAERIDAEGSAREPADAASDAVVKRLRAEHATSTEARGLLAREAELLRRLAHPAIPRLYAAADARGGCYLVMERAPGSSLADLLARERGAIPLDAACGIVVQLCDALHHVHACAGDDGAPLGVVHRDVTARNVIVASDGRVRLIDFGVARVGDTDDRVPRGSLGAMAPEQIRGEPVDARADVFALGVMLYELSVGEAPFVGDAIERMRATVERDAPRPSERVAGYASALEDVVLGALRRQRDARTASAALLGQRIEAFCAAAGIVASPAAVGRWARSPTTGTT